jgi:hypothetical protein
VGRQPGVLVDPRCLDGSARIAKQKITLGLTMARPYWLIRPRSDGGCDYVSFIPASGGVEIREGSHLPPQMPLLKRRRRLASEEAEACRRQLQQEAGYHHSEPLF